MTAHTPGPWRWLNDATLMADHGHRHIVLVAGHHRGSLEQRGEDGLLHLFDCGSPDACLIAAAPDLLAALEMLIAKADAALETCGRAGVSPLSLACAVGDARDAVRKARGADRRRDEGCDHG